MLIISFNLEQFPQLCFVFHATDVFEECQLFSRMSLSLGFSCLCDPVDCNLPGSSVHGVFQARILGWVAIHSPGDLPDPGMEPGAPALQADSLLTEPTGKSLV